jgi:hypothetical protein
MFSSTVSRGTIFQVTGTGIISVCVTPQLSTASAFCFVLLTPPAPHSILQYSRSQHPQVAVVFPFVISTKVRNREA